MNEEDINNYKFSYKKTLCKSFSQAEITLDSPYRFKQDWKISASLTVFGFIPVIGKIGKSIISTTYDMRNEYNLKNYAQKLSDLAACSGDFESIVENVINEIFLKNDNIYKKLCYISENESLSLIEKVNKCYKYAGDKIKLVYCEKFPTKMHKLGNKHALKVISKILEGNVSQNDFKDFLKDETLVLIQNDSYVKTSGSQPYIILSCGFIFKFTHNKMKCFKVDFKLKDCGDWTTIIEGHNKNCYYVSKRIGNEIFVKVENVPCQNGELEFKISFKDSKGKILEEVCNGTVKENWNDKINFKNLRVSLPKGITDRKNEFFKFIDKNKILFILCNDRKKRTGLEYYNINIPNDVTYVLICKTFEDNYVISKFHSYFSSKQNKEQQKTKKIQKQETTKYRKIYSLLPEYDLYAHASRLKINVKKLKKIQSYNNSFVLFLSDHSHVIIARIVCKESDKSLLDCIKIESENCLTDIILFINIYKDLIYDKQLFISGILVLPTIKQESLPEELCFLFSDQFKFESSFNFLCEDELEDVEKFKIWLEKITKSEGFLVDNSQITKEKNKLFKKMIGLAMMFMLEIDFPNYKANIPEQITSLVLNIEQYDAIKDEGKNKKKIITGGFGSGKSVVGKEIVRNIIKKSRNRSITLYYICCNHFSLYECEMKQFINDELIRVKPTNVTVHCDNLFNLWNKVPQDKDEISIPDTLEHYATITSDDVCFVLEELSDEYFKEEDVKKLNERFLEPSNKLNKCLVVFIPESIKKNSELVNENTTDKINIKKSCFTEEFLGKSMKIITLKKSMRVTQGIKLLIDSFQKAIEEKQTVIRFSNDNQVNTQEKNSTEIRYSYSALTEESGNNIQSEPTVADDLNPTARTYYDNDSDSFHKYIKKDPKGSNCIEINCVFDETNFGHSIKGPRPKIIYFPFSNITDINSVYLLSDVLRKHCIFENGPKTVVICNNMDEVESVSFAIKKANTEKKKFFKAIIYTPHLRKCTPSIEDKKKVKQSTNIKSHILVTDHKGFSGAESESVIIFVDPNDIYLRHTVINAMARSNSHLTFLVLGKIVLHSENSVGSIITEWTSEWIDKIEIKPNNCAYGKEEFEAYRKKEKFEINMEHDNMYKIKASQTAELAKKGKSDTKKNEYESTDFELTKSEKTELKKRMDDREYRGFPNIADYLFDRDVEKIKFYYSKEIGDADLKRITTPIELIQTLEDRMLLGNGDYISFVEVLRKIGRNDLAGYLTWKSDTR